ncbi:chemotaxis protein CheX [Pseudalkalibacillus salsuginis]|uniref:chemotaxis protein CheX n=1 Tax=Pseudalkalibacillus salsuginis TaxID=2910972 RepID=UPI001F3C6AF7|nr:chemotaxis protein CheX [Pseudalkalibacillus salsuginis]MCF6410852.1 chemotaxis protein CheX [Pseudalkalibacillus salsuginis]
MAIAAAEHITNLLNGTINVIKTVIPIEFQMGKPQSEVDLHLKEEEQVGVIIGLEKEINGSLLFLASRAFFGECGNKMYGMPFEGEMLESFVRELGNILAGNIATQLSNEDITVDITTPRIVSEVSITDAEKQLSIPLKFGSEELTIVFAVY